MLFNTTPAGRNLREGAAAMACVPAVGGGWGRHVFVGPPPLLPLTALPVLRCSAAGRARCCACLLAAQACSACCCLVRCSPALPPCCCEWHARCLHLHDAACTCSACWHESCLLFVMCARWNSELLRVCRCEYCPVLLLCSPGAARVCCPCARLIRAAPAARALPGAATWLVLLPLHMIAA